MNNTHKHATVVAGIVWAIASICHTSPALANESCPRPIPGSPATEPENLRSVNSVLRVDLTVRSDTPADGPARYCYLLADGSQSPTLRLKPGDWLIINLKNEISGPGNHPSHGVRHPHGKSIASDPCTSGAMPLTSTNLHFHGLTLPPVCHQDEGSGHATEWRDRVVVSPGGRVEFIMVAPPVGAPAMLVTRAVDTGPDGENDPNRALISIATAQEIPSPPSLLPATGEPLPAPARPWLGSVTPTRVRQLYFSEDVSDPHDPNSPTKFYLTVDGQTPATFDPAATEPNIVVRQGDVEDWII